MKEQLTQEILNKFLEIKEITDNKIIETAVIVRNNDLRYYTSFIGSYESHEYEGNNIVVKFSESWAYGGYDSYHIDFPFTYLTKSEDEIIAELKPTNDVIIKRREAAKITSEQAEKKRDLELFKQLRDKLKKGRTRKRGEISTNISER